jgi:hypothetical protein
LTPERCHLSIASGTIDTQPAIGKGTETLRPRGILKRSRKVLIVARVIASERGVHRSAWYLLSATAVGIARLINDACLALYSAAARKPLVHVIGDSHSKTFKGNRPFVVHHIGAATAHNLKKKNNSTKSNEKLFDEIERIRRKDVVVLVFGEIDCRIHAYYQFRKNEGEQTISHILDLTVSNYGDVLQEIRELGLSPCICSVAPATTAGNEYNFPYYATPELRCEITRMFNEKLAAFCRENDYVYIDVYSNVCDENGLMLPEYAGDDIHLNTEAVSIARAELREKLGVNI